jgi:predicted SAM-dependent methyltransferase
LGAEPSIHARIVVIQTTSIESWDTTGIGANPVSSLSAEVAGRFFLYRRYGFDERLMHLQPGGLIGQGNAGREHRWELVIRPPLPAQLILWGADGIETCRLSRADDGVWRGAWARHEQMSVDLVPQPDGYSLHDWRIEIGAGEHPHPDYHVHTDVLPLPDIEYVCPMDRLPFADATFTALRANDVLEHQSWELVPATLAEWARVLTPGASAYIQVPDGRHLIDRWVGGSLTIQQLNYWLLGGHGSDRQAHRGHDERGVPRWLWNAHHTIFTAEWLAELVSASGFVQPRIASDGGSNLMCWATRRP